jgi:polyisoprenoid-binding protein YceI
MKSLPRLAGALGLVGLIGLTAAAFGPRVAESSAATQYSIDPVHSALVFRIRYNGIANFWGRFNELSGNVLFDPEDLEKTSIEVTVKAASVDTGNERRDGHLKSPDFLSAKQHEEIRFKSTGVKKTGDDSIEVTGDLTLRGVTRSVTAKVRYGGQAPNFDGGVRLGFDGSLTIDRGEFGVSFGKGTLGDEVELILGLTAVGK